MYDANRPFIIFTRAEGTVPDITHGDEHRYNEAVESGVLTLIDWSRDPETREDVRFDMIALCRVEKIRRRGL